MTKKKVWQKPRLRNDETTGEDRRVGWLELFYDLVFVVVIAELSHYLIAHLSIGGAAGFILLFLPVWWTWISGTIYNERFETDGLDNRIFTFIQMLFVAALAVFVHDGLGKLSSGFALSYTASRVFIIFLWWRAGKHEPVARPVTNLFIAGFSLSVLLFIISVLVDPPVKFILWGIGLIIDLVTPWFSLKHQKKLPPLTTTHLPERFGLFVLIVLGESVAGVVRGAAVNQNLTWQVFLTGLLGMLLAFGLWWIYFDFVARRAAKKTIWFTALWSYLHLPLVVGIVAVGGGIQNLVGADYVEHGEQWLITIGTAVTLAAIGFLEMTLERRENEPTHPLFSPFSKIITAFSVIGLGFLPASSTVLLLILFAILLSQIFYGLFVWYGREMPEQELEI